MRKICKQSLLILLIAIIFSFAALSCSATGVKDAPLDTIGTVMAQSAYEVTITGNNINLTKYKTMTLKAEVTGVTEQPEITWTSSDTKVATVDENGIVKGVDVGRALITASAEVAGQTVEGYYSVNVVSIKDPIRELFANYNILSYRYNYVDDVYYADDKNCWQKYFGFARIYDIIAPYIALEYDYTRVFFTYEEKDFMVQLWKGQYGLVFYGGEIGIYSKPASDKEVGMFTFFEVAEEEDWPHMELTVYHQKVNGEWEREFTRDYDRYWWCTGFKAGHLRVQEPADELRLVGRITFTDAEMAELFSQGLIDCGFTKAIGKDSVGLDSFYTEGADVYVTWQNISEAENTMPLKIGAAALMVFNVFALIIAALLMMGFGGIILMLFFVI